MAAGTSSSLQNLSSSSCLLLNSHAHILQSYGALHSQDDCDCGELNGRRRRRTVASSSCSSLFSFHAGTLLHSHLTPDTSRFSLCRMHGSHCSVAPWRSRSSDLSDPCCADGQCRRSDSSQLALSDSPPTYRDARFFPSLIVHWSERGEDRREARRYHIRRGSACVERDL
ncbi:hypothetical protein OJAV_G00214620 [Oryzias javanicus]|uniref:Uncharacterized protein n=1 Tax=Oryzias javanicus TaxID=123683 RepID=A0A3S2TWU2_ORYJA|nr:hypothetical protein OJAV_G00214620 [Oryzias javanicus]